MSAQLSRPESSPVPFLSQPLLLEVVGPTVFKRGEALLERGRVTSALRSGEGLVGEVLNRHGQPYSVSVSADEDGLECTCECPAWFDAGFCKHVVALALSGLRFWGTGLSSPAPAEAPASPQPSSQERPASAKALQQWLQAHHLAHVRGEPVASLSPLLSARARAFLHGPPVERLVDVLTTAPSFSWLPDAVWEEWQRAAWAWLCAEAERVRLGLERERSAPPRPPPTDARLAPLVAALERERVRVRAHAVPRLWGEVRPSYILEESPLRLWVMEPGRASSGPLVKLGRVRVEPRALLEEGPALGCPCTPEGPVACVHALSALDAVLDMLCDPGQASSASRLAELLFEAPQREILAALRKAAAYRQQRQQEAPAAPCRVSFRLQLSGGQVQLRPFLHRPLKRGGFSKGSALRGPEDVGAAREALSEASERAALELCTAQSETSSYTTRYRTGSALALRALKLLAHSPRLFLEERLDAPLRVREAGLGWSFEDVDGGLRVRLAVEGAPVPLEALRMLSDTGEDSAPWALLEPSLPRLTLVSVPSEALHVLSALHAHGTLLPESARKPLLRHLGELEASFPLLLPESLEGRAVEPTPGLLVRLRPLDEDEESLEVLLRVRPLPEAPPQPPGEGPPVLRALRAKERICVRRHLEAERAEADALRARLELPAPGPSGAVVVQGAEAALELLERLEPLRGPALRVEWDEKAWRVSHWSDAAALRVSVRRAQHWFGVEGDAEVDGQQVPLALLLEAVRAGRRYVALGPGRWLRLTEALRERLTPLADLAHPTRHGLEVSAAAAPALDALAEAGVQVRAPPDWRKLAGRIRQAQARPVPLPEGLRAQPRDYQREGFEWMARLGEWGGGGCLADDMGLGKTLQALALLVHRAPEGPALVVAPTSVCFNWAREAERFAPTLRLHSYREAERERLLGALGKGDVLVASYGLLVRDAERFAGVQWATLVVDEAQAAKNPDTARARALRGLKAQARLALTGTPVENRLDELWSLFQVVFPGLLGSRESFRQRFASPIEKDKDPRARAALARVVRPFVLRRTKAQVARELPPRIETVVPVALSAEERQLYEATRLAALASLEGAGPEQRFEVLAALTRLRQLACHPRLVDPDSPVPSSKLERFLERLEEVRAEGGRALVFSQFTRHLALVREALEEQGVVPQYLDGQTPPAERQARVEAFQRGEGEVFLISVKAGGTGLNLTAADHVIHLDPWWNPAVEDQATDRAHRIGQTRTVTVSRLVAQGTIEEAILALHAEKRELANSLLSEADGAGALSTEQLLALLRYTG